MKIDNEFTIFSHVGKKLFHHRLNPEDKLFGAVWVARPVDVYPSGRDPLLPEYVYEEQYDAELQAKQGTKKKMGKTLDEMLTTNVMLNDV